MNADERAADAGLKVPAVEVPLRDLGGGGEGSEVSRIPHAIPRGPGEAQPVSAAARGEGLGTVPHPAMVGLAQQDGEVRRRFVINLSGGLAGCGGRQQLVRFPGGFQIEDGALAGGKRLLGSGLQMRHRGAVLALCGWQTGDTSGEAEREDERQDVERDFHDQVSGAEAKRISLG